ncbi:MAG: hypothetical protein NTY53_17015 [Kiritimatiellaeota bacterium]|nr:hypothetical protein [Kiritimatiellota bacterium]
MKRNLVRWAMLSVTVPLFVYALVLDPTHLAGKEKLGFGAEVVSVDFSRPARVITLMNIGTGTVFVAINSTSNALATAMTAGEAFPLPAGQVLTLDGLRQEIASIQFGSAAATNLVTLGVLP